MPSRSSLNIYAIFEACSETSTNVDADFCLINGMLMQLAKATAA